MHNARAPNLDHAHASELDRDRIRDPNPEAEDRNWEWKRQEDKHSHRKPECHGCTSIGRDPSLKILDGRYVKRATDTVNGTKVAMQ